MPGFSFLVVSLLFLLAASFVWVMEPNSSAIQWAYWNHSLRGKSAEA